LRSLAFLLLQIYDLGQSCLYLLCLDGFDDVPCYVSLLSPPLLVLVVMMSIPAQIVLMLLRSRHFCLDPMRMIT